MKPARQKRRNALGLFLPLAGVIMGVAGALPPLPQAADATVTARTKNPSNTFSTTALYPISGLAVTTSCDGLTHGKAAVSWTTITPSTFASGYKVERWLGNPGTTLQSTTDVTPRTATGPVASSQMGLAPGTTYTWKVYAYFQSWTSTVVSQSATTPVLVFNVCL